MEWMERLQTWPRSTQEHQAGHCSAPLALSLPFQKEPVHDKVRTELKRADRRQSSVSLWDWRPELPREALESA